MKIVGIDPGSQVAGFAVIESLVPAPMNPRQYKVVDIGVWRFKRGLPHSERLATLHQVVFELLSSHKPDICVLEKAFGGVNIGSALKLGEARGVVVAAASRCQSELIQINPTHAKKSVTGKGHAGKDEVAQCLKLIMGFDRGNLPHDATDALCLALAFGLTTGIGGVISKLSMIEKSNSPT